MTSLDPVISTQRDGALIRIAIQRPEKRNALASSHWAAIEAALDAAAASDARIVVLSGVPGAFSAGADIDELGQLLAEPQAFADNNALVQRTQRKLQQLPQTTIAVIDGACVGGGLGLALACDLRLASARSRFAITPAKLGLVYSADDSARLVHAVGMARARELLLTGRLLDAPTAAAWGLVNTLCEDADALAAAQDALVESLRATSGAARSGIKTVLAHVGGDRDVDAAAAAAAFNDAFHSADFAEGAAAFLAKRAPSFR
jgi:enoyl-CoA hydratase